MGKGRIFLWVFVVVLIIILLVASGIFLTKKYNLSDKFGISGNVVKYGTYQNEEEITKKFSTIYAEGLKDGKKTYLVLGNQKEIKVLSYEEVSQGKINLLMENKEQKMDVKENRYSLTKIIPKNNKVEILINEKIYEFELKENENIYFIISEDVIVKDINH
ncbi:MAG: hypothetical protein WC584_02060 [Candidatus Pacearchaeota archaeon]